MKVTGSFFAAIGLSWALGLLGMAEAQTQVAPWNRLRLRPEGELRLRYPPPPPEANPPVELPPPAPPRFMAVGLGFRGSFQHIRAPSTTLDGATLTTGGVALRIAANDPAGLSGSWNRGGLMVGLDATISTGVGGIAISSPSTLSGGNATIDIRAGVSVAYVTGTSADARRIVIPVEFFMDQTLNFPFAGSGLGHGGENIRVRPGIVELTRSPQGDWYRRIALIGGRGENTFPRIRGAQHITAWTAGAEVEGQSYRNTQSTQMGSSRLGSRYFATMMFLFPEAERSRFAVMARAGGSIRLGSNTCLAIFAEALFRHFREIDVGGHGTVNAFDLEAGVECRIW